MSALPPKADMLIVGINVCFVRIADIGLHQHWVPMAGVFARTRMPCRSLLEA